MRSSTDPPSRPSLAELTKAPNYLNGVSELMSRLAETHDTAQALELLQDVTARLGAEVSVFQSFVPEDRSTASCRFLLNCDPQWSSEYEELGGCAEDPWLDHALTHSEPVRGSELGARTDSQRRLLALAKSFGFSSSVIVPAPSSGRLGRVGVLCLGSSVPGFFEAEGYVRFRLVARSVAMEINEWWIARMREELIAKAAIDEEDRRLLALAASGHSSKEIGRKLTLSRAAVDSRLRRIRSRLAVGSRRSVSVLAAEYGLIRPPSLSDSRPRGIKSSTRPQDLATARSPERGDH